VDSWGLVLAMLERANRNSDDSTVVGDGPIDPSQCRFVSFYDAMPEFGLSGSAVEFIAHVFNGSWDLFEHGTGVGSSWLTEDGRDLMLFLQQYGTNPEEWPEWITDEETVQSSVNMGLFIEVLELVQKQVGLLTTTEQFQVYNQVLDVLKGMRDAK
jgi:hypothetical protein